jgi:hypothetical protein
MRAGSFGYVDVWTVGYVDSIDLDFGEIGKISISDIEQGTLDSKYNLGLYNVTDLEGYQRNIPNAKAISYADGFAHHYTASKDDEKWLSEGTQIRIPTSLTDTDLSTQSAVVYAWKNGVGTKTNAVYVLFDTFTADIHYRVTWE